MSVQERLDARAAGADHPCVMSDESIRRYIQWEQARGASENALRRCKCFTAALYGWLPEDKIITRERLASWRSSLKDSGYSAQTRQNYAKGINRYLDYMGWEALRFTQGSARDISGMEFGYLTALERTGEKNRRDWVWRCRCRCGGEVTLPATQLLTGRTRSCGCLRGEHLRSVNQFYEGTSLRRSLEERVSSTRAESGYTGVTKKRGRWQAYIGYKGKNHSLGSYDNLEDAVKARARGKESVQKDARELLAHYEALQPDTPELPMPFPAREEPRPEPGGRPVRSNNTSGVPGVYEKRGKWSAKITYRKVTYQLGTFEQKEAAVAARREAERLLEEDPQKFLIKYAKKENR